MGKTPKKAASGGDERNLYNRRLLKATTAASKTSETNLYKSQRESENPNRSKLSTTQKRLPSGQKKAFKTKHCVPTKIDQSHPMKKVGRPLGSTKKAAFVNKNVEAASSKMQPDSEEAETKLDRTVENKNQKQEISKETENSAEKRVDRAPVESVQVSKEERHELVIEEEVAETERNDETESAESKKAEELEENEENDLKLTLESDDGSVKVREEKSSEEESRNEKNEDGQVRIELESSSQEKKEDTPNPNDSRNATESVSVDIPESPRSELSEVSEVASRTDSRNEKEKDEESTDDKNQSFVSYDPAITLKDVQIKLNDCMKENSKVSEAGGTELARDRDRDRERERESEPDREQDRESELETLSRTYQDLSFGKTLRSISGRRSLSRMRHVTIREHRYSPNNSMFVNMSSASLMPDDNEDFKILRYSTGLSDTVSTSNGSPMEKKRKHETVEDWNSVTKKQKTNESDNSLLNSSISLLKGLRRPIQVSTPVSELKFQTSRLDLSDDEANKPMNDRAPKKWCTIM